MFISQRYLCMLCMCYVQYKYKLTQMIHLKHIAHSKGALGYLCTIIQSRRTGQLVAADDRQRFLLV